MPVISLKTCFRTIGKAAAPVWLLCFVGYALSGCESIENSRRTPEERAVLDFSVQGFRLGQHKEVLANYENVDKLPGFRNGFEEFHILTPAPQISMIALFFRNDILRRIDIRYFDGPTARTMRRAGGWRGILQHIESRYGAPSETGAKVLVASTQPGLKAQYAKFNGVWSFPKIRRQLNFIAMEDGRGGVAIVTASDTTPEVRRAVAVVRPTPTPVPTSLPQDTTTDVVASGAASPVAADPSPPQPRIIDPGF